MTQEFKTDVQIAQEATMLPISEVAKQIGISDDYLIHYGKYKAKIDLKLLEELKDKEDGKLILVSAINPTPAGEGKTTVNIWTIIWSKRWSSRWRLLTSCANGRH